MPIIISTEKVTDLLYKFELPEDRQKDVDLSDEGLNFFLYRGDAYDTAEFLHRGSPWVLHFPDVFADWDAYLDMSWWSGLLIKLDRENSKVKVGYYYVKEDE